MGYNRGGIEVLAVPIPLGIFILITTLVVRSYKRRRLLRVNKTCALWMIPGVLCAVSAVLIFSLIETTTNYQYVHSAWHVLIALSLVFLLPYCKKSSRPVLPKSESLSSEESELNEISSLDSWSREVGSISVNTTPAPGQSTTA